MTRSVRDGMRAFIVGLFVLLPVVASHVAHGEILVLKDGRSIEGKLGTVASLAENPLQIAAGKATNPAVRTIVFTDDNLRRTFVSKSLVTKMEQDGNKIFEKINIPQRVAQTGLRIGRVGPIIDVSKFDEYGRRNFKMMTDKGPVTVVQGITEITPLWTKVEGVLTSDMTPYVWDMRIATSSIPREVLNEILAKRIDPTKADHRLRLVRLFVQGERYQDAQRELEAIVKDFPERQELQNEVRALQQINSRRVIDEINMRRKAGQHQFSYNLLNNFPSTNVAGETLAQVREILNSYTEMQKQGKQVLDLLKTHLEAIKNSPLHARCEPIYQEIVRELNIHTIHRMADYLRLNDDAQLSAEQKFSLAASGWLLGANEATPNLVVSISLFEVRNLVRQYLNEATAINRAPLLKRIQGQEGGTPGMVAKLIANMKPPVETPEASPDKPGFYQLEIPGIDGEPNVPYLVQLPPEYNPYRRYPTVVTLNGSGTSPEQQVDWWAGALGPSGNRLGQASRHGYIVVAVGWAKEEQKRYDYSAREHAAVLGALRDACRRFAIDTDRVFLSGHSSGGDAAWDIALAHPDLWAGVIPIVAVTDRYCSLYWENADLLSFYIVAGELDGDKTVKNSRDVDRYLSHRYDVTVTEYEGRGHEHFYEEIQRIFDWMNRRERNFFPKEFSVATMRSWDNFFWWLELKGFPEKGIVDPSNWPPKRGVLPIKSEASCKVNSIYITTGANKATLWLSPEIVEFDKPLRVTVNGQRLSRSPEITGDLSVMLEDVRTRGDRQHPFWAKVE